MRRHKLVSPYIVVVAAVCLVETLEPTGVVSGLSARLLGVRSPDPTIRVAALFVITAIGLLPLLQVPAFEKAWPEIWTAFLVLLVAGLWLLPPPGRIAVSSLVQATVLPSPSAVTSSIAIDLPAAKVRSNLDDLAAGQQLEVMLVAAGPPASTPTTSKGVGPYNVRLIGILSGVEELLNRPYWNAAKIRVAMQRTADDKLVSDFVVQLANATDIYLLPIIDTPTTVPTSTFTSTSVPTRTPGQVPTPTNTPVMTQSTTGIPGAVASSTATSTPSVMPTPVVLSVLRTGRSSSVYSLKVSP